MLRERAAALEPRIAHLVIEVADPDPKLVVKRGAGELPLERAILYGKAKAVDPGHYDIVAKAPGKKPWKKRVEVAAGASIITVEVPRLEPLEEEEGAPAPEPKRQLKNRSRRPRQSTTHRLVSASDEGRTWPRSAWAASASAGLALGTIMALKYNSANSDAKNICPQSHDCTTQQISDHDQKVEDARSARTWTYVGFSVGTFGLAAAAALLFMPKSSGTESAWVASPVVAGSDALGANMEPQILAPLGRGSRAGEAARLGTDTKCLHGASAAMGYVRELCFVVPGGSGAWFARCARSQWHLPYWCCSRRRAPALTLG